MSEILSSYLLIILLAILGVSLLVHLLFYLIPYTYILRRKRRERLNLVEKSDEKPPVSVIICAKNEGENLLRFLPLVLEQQYPEYEVILVNDGSWDNTEKIINDFKKEYNNLYITNIPTETKIISHKKLAITVGVKAAKHEHLLFIDADCRPLTPHWITNMVANFTDKKEFILGFGNYYRNKGILGSIINYDTLLIAMQYMGFAALDVPYMGVGRNMAYRRSTFFNRKGFAGFLHVASGDDDLLVNSAGNKENTALEPKLGAITISLPETSFKEWFYQKYRHLSTGKLYNTKSKVLLMIEPLFKALFFASIIALIAVGYSNIIVISTVVGALVIKYLVQYIVINTTSRTYNQKGFGLSLILCDIFLPLVSLYICTVGKLMIKNRGWK